MAESKKEYKARVLEAKKIVETMFVTGQAKDFSLSKIEKDVKEYLDSQDLTKFDLRTNGDRKNQAMFQAFTNSANKGIMEILQVIIPELASSLDLKQFMLFGEESLDRNEEVKKEWENGIEDFFTMNIIPGQRPLVDLGFTPEKFGERVADQMGQSLIEFLPFMIAPNMIATNGPVQGFAQAVKMDPTKIGKVMDVLKNSYYSIINSYIKNPGKSFQADIAAAIGWGAGQQMGTEISEAAEEEGTMGYYDAIKGQPLETMLGFTGATTGVLLAPVVTAAFQHPFRTAGALVGGAFKNYGGIKPIVDKFQTWYKAKNKKTVSKFVDGVATASKEKIAAAEQIAEKVAGTKTTAFEASGQQGATLPRIISRPKLDADGNQILDKDGKPIIEKIETGPELKLSFAEETLSPGAAAEQMQIENTMVGQELDKIVKRRINNLKILDQSLETIVPSTDENFQYVLDLRSGTIKPLIESLEKKINIKSDEISGELGTIQADLTKKESGLGLRQIIENLQLSESKESLDIISNIPAGKTPIFSGTDAGSAPKILEDLLSIAGLRTFEKGTEPAILKKIKSLVDNYKLKDVENIRDYKRPTDDSGYMVPEDQWNKMSVSKKKEFLENNFIDSDSLKIATINQEAQNVFTNQSLYDIYLSADAELMSLIGKPGIDVTKQIMKLKLIKNKIFSELKTNLKDEEGGTKFIKSVDKYIDKFEKGVIVRVRENKVAGYTKKDEAVADAFFNPENVKAIDDFINAFGTGKNINEDALYNMQQAILDRLANKVIDKKTFILNQDEYRRWLVQHGSVLERLSAMAKNTGMPDFIASLRETPTAIGALSERLSTLETRKTFLQGEKLKTSLKTFGLNSKQLNLGSVDEYVNAALSDSKVMSNITDRIIKDGAEEVWVKSILEQLVKIRKGAEGSASAQGFKQGFILPAEVRGMQSWLDKNSKSLEILFKKVGYKNHLENIKAIVSGFERANFVPPSKGSPALTPDQQTKAVLGVDVPALWSRIFAVKSGRVGKEYVGMEVFNRFANTVGAKNFDTLMKKAMYDPEFAKSLSKAATGGKFTINEQKQIYGFLAKLNGTIGIASEDGAEGSTVQTEADTKVIQNNKQNYEDLPDPPNIEEFNQLPVVQESRLSSDIINPLGMRGMPEPNAARNTASVSPDTYLKGQQLFNKPGEITFASQGGIMNARKQIQRVA